LFTPTALKPCFRPRLVGCSGGRHLRTWAGEPDQSGTAHCRSQVAWLRMASRCEAVPGKALVSIPAEAKGQVELELLPVPRLIIPSGAWQTTSEAMTSTSVSDMAYTTAGEKIFSSPRTICRSVYPDRYQRTSAHQEPPVHLREEAYSPLACTMVKRVRTVA